MYACPSAVCWPPDYGGQHKEWERVMAVALKKNIPHMGQLDRRRIEKIGSLM